MAMRNAFSLIELSIVLVILGLLTGGILSGQSLIRASELRSVTADFNRYRTAVFTFRDKYFALPGDMTNAQAFWGVRAAGTNLVCQQTLNVTTGTCNSDGNGIVDALSTDGTMYNERFLAWQHLAYAGLIEGAYTGASGGSSGIVSNVGSNVPGAKLSSGFFAFAYLGNYSGNANLYDRFYGQAIQLSSTSGKPLTPTEAWNLDTKLDDGKPATGAVFAPKMTSTWAPNCTDSDAATANYNVAQDSKLCTVWMIFL